MYMWIYEAIKSNEKSICFDTILDVINLKIKMASKIDTKDAFPRRIKGIWKTIFAFKFIYVHDVCICIWEQTNTLCTVHTMHRNANAMIRECMLSNRKGYFSSMSQFRIPFILPTNLSNNLEEKKNKIAYSQRTKYTE